MAAPAEGEEPPPLEPAPPITQEEYEARFAHYQAIFESISTEDAKKASKLGRKADGKTNPEDFHLTYGEVEMSLLYELIELVKKDVGPLFINNGCFLDLGSGVGKACVAAALLHSFEKVVGIEILSSLHDLASVAQSTYDARELGADLPKPAVKLDKGDIKELAAAVAPEVTVALALATAYGIKELDTIKEVAKLMPDNSIFITFTHMLPPALIDHAAPNEPMKPEEGGWKLVHERVAEMAWGKTSCYVFKKEPAPAPPEPAEGEAPPAEGS